MVERERMGTIAKPPLYRVALAQLLVAVAVSGALLINDTVQGYSFLTGCLVQISGSLYFAWQAFRYRGARQVRSMVQAMYRGETGKIILSGAFFAAVFVIVKPLNVVLVFAGYLGMVVLHLILSAKQLK